MPKQITEMLYSKIYTIFYPENIIQLNNKVKKWDREAYVCINNNELTFIVKLLMMMRIAPNSRARGEAGEYTQSNLFEILLNQPEIRL